MFALTGEPGEPGGQGRCVPGFRWTAGAGGSGVTEPEGRGIEGRRAEPAACPAGQLAGFRLAETGWAATEGPLHESARRCRAL